MSSNNVEKETAAAAAAEGAAGGGDDDSENDDDYVPEEMDEDDEDAIAPAVGLQGPHLSATKRKAVDEAFENLFGYPFGTKFQPKRRRHTETTPPRLSKRERLLTDIFGPSTAALLLATSSSVRMNQRKHDSLPLTVEKTITEVKRFAGKNVTVERTITVPSSEGKGEATAPATGGTVDNHSSKPPLPTMAASDKPAAAGALDSVLAEIAGPSKLSTVAKTSADWDAYKTKTGVDQELEKQAQSNKAYLVKQDFLTRVDHRRFEHERAQRDRERATRK